MTSTNWLILPGWWQMASINITNVWAGRVARKVSRVARSASKDAFWLLPIGLRRWPRIGVRAGLGLDVALQEMGKGAGTTYHAVVVKVCIKVFGEGGYQLLNRG